MTKTMTKPIAQSTIKDGIKWFKGELFNAYYQNNHLPMGLKFIYNANEQSLTVKIKAYGILINPIWINVCKILYVKSQGKYIAQLAEANDNVINDDEDIAITNYLNLPASKDEVIESNSSDEATTKWHND